MIVHLIKVFENEDRGYTYGKEREDVSVDSLGELFKHLQREYGRCMSKVYVDKPDGTAREVGWTFEKRVGYIDSRDTFRRLVWVEYQVLPDLE